MDLAILLTLENLQDANPAFVAFTALGGSNVGVSTICQILEQHLASWTDHLLIHDTVSDGCSATCLQLVT